MRQGERIALVLVLLGLAAIVTGIALIFVPAALIVGGGGAVAVGIFADLAPDGSAVRR